MARIEDLGECDRGRAGESSDLAKADRSPAFVQGFPPARSSRSNGTSSWNVAAMIATILEKISKKRPSRTYFFRDAPERSKGKAADADVRNQVRSAVIQVTGRDAPQVSASFRV